MMVLNKNNHHHMFISSIPKAAVNIAGTLQELNSVFFYPLHLELMYVLNIEFIQL